MVLMRNVTAMLVSCPEIGPYLVPVSFHPTPSSSLHFTALKERLTRVLSIPRFFLPRTHPQVVATEIRRPRSWPSGVLSYTELPGLASAKPGVAGNILWHHPQAGPTYYCHAERRGPSSRSFRYHCIFPWCYWASFIEISSWTAFYFHDQIGSSASEELVSNMLCHAMRRITFTTLLKYTKVHLTAEYLSESPALTRIGSGKWKEIFTAIRVASNSPHLTRG